MYTQTHNIARLLDEKDDWRKSDFVFFWKTFNESVNKQVFSQWYMRDFVVDGTTYNCAEQFMMAEKARIFKCDDVRDRIIRETNPAKIKRLGREVRNFSDSVWKKHRFDVVVRGNIAKFSQNEDLKEFLLATGDKVLVEASPMDRIWGIGMDEKAYNVAQPDEWQGKNLLGFALMEVRDILKREQ